MHEEAIVLAGGCFWCIEAVFADLKGVSEVVSGYTGGDLPNPTYDQVCSGRTGHAEAVLIRYDPDTISLADILRIFFTLHDPTTLNRQGADVGTQYRSAVFYATPEQRQTAQDVMQEIADEGVWEDPLVTTLEPLGSFYPAEDYHQAYFKRFGNQPYCQVVIAPKVAKLRALYADRLRA